jgi:membrane protease YdiL (CAAX protease family)
VESAPAQVLKAGRGKNASTRQSTARLIPSDWVLNPYLSFLLLVGVGLASLRLSHQLRLTMLWLMMLALVLLNAEAGRLKAKFSLVNLARGALIGTVVALPFFLFAPDFFYATALRLYGVQELQVLLERAVFLVPLLEEGFFRGVVQRERGLRDGALLFGLMQVLYFFSAANVFPLVVAAVVVGMVVVGLLCGYMYERYGLMGSIGCHVAVNLVLLVLPAVVSSISNLLAL